MSFKGASSPIRTVWSTLSRASPGVVIAVLIFVAARVGLVRAIFGMPVGVDVALSILLIAATLWVTEAVPLFVTSLLVLALEMAWLSPTLERLGTIAPVSVFLTPFFSDVTLLFLGGFVISAALQSTHLDEAIVRIVIKGARRDARKARWLLIATTALLSMWMSNTAAAAMMLAIVNTMRPVCDPKDHFRKTLLVGVCFAANIGGLATPIGTPPNAIAMQYMQRAGIAPSFATWMLLALPFVVVLLALLIFVLSRVFPSELTTLELEPPAATNTPSPGVTRFTLAVVALTVVLWVTTGLHHASPGLVALFPIIAFFGSGLLRPGDVRTLPWDVILLVGGGLSLGDAVERGGLAAWLVTGLPVTDVSSGTLLVVVAVTAALMSAFMSNTAAANLLLPVVMTLNTPARASLLIAVAFCCSLSMPLPVSTPANAMAFASGKLSVRDIFWPGLLITVSGVLLTISLGPGLWRIILAYAGA